MEKIKEKDIVKDIYGNILIVIEVKKNKIIVDNNVNILEYNLKDLEKVC